MGGLVAVIDKKGKKAAVKALDMLKTLRHRFDSSVGIAIENLVSIAKDYAKLTDKIPEIPEASAAIGYGLCNIKPKDMPQPIMEEDFVFIFEGRFFPQQSPSDLETVKMLLKQNPAKKAAEIIEKLDGSYSFVVLHKNLIIAGRDSFGTRPLYYGENSQFSALASEMKALWKLGMKDVGYVDPGTLLFLSGEGCVSKEVRKLPERVEEQVNEAEAIKRLQSLLLEAVRERVEDLSEVAVAFSGGVDSGTLAFLTAKCNVEPQLVCVGMEGRGEFQESIGLAEQLDLPLHMRVLSEEEIEEMIPKVLWLIEEPDPVKLSIAIPFFAVAETAKKLGFNVLLAGQGSDELFGGYKRYLQLYSEKGKNVLHKLLYKDFTECYRNNFERDEKVCAFNKVELRLPFVDWELANYVLQLPVEFKILSENDQLRKHILRKSMEKMGLPKPIAYKPKKAVQYATGVNATLKKIARRKGLSLREYVKQIFNEVYSRREDYEENRNYL